MVSNPRSHLFTCATLRIPIHATPKSGTEPFRYVTLHFGDRHGEPSFLQGDGFRGCRGCAPPPPPPGDLRLSNTAIQNLLYRLMFTLCHCLVKSLLLRIRFAFKICLRHQLVTPVLSGVPPPKKKSWIPPNRHRYITLKSLFLLLHW